MTCKDCVHYDVCNRIGNKILNGFEVCDQFKDKTRFVELPCKVGDTVYYITGINRTLIMPAIIKEIILDDCGIKDLYVEGNGCYFENSFDIFSLTHEEAEKAIERSKDNA